MPFTRISQVLQHSWYRLRIRFVSDTQKIEKRKATEKIIFFFIDFILFFVKNLSWLRNIWYTIPIRDVTYLSNDHLSFPFHRFYWEIAMKFHTCSKYHWSIWKYILYFRLLGDVWSLKFFNEVKSEELEHRLFFEWMEYRPSRWFQ